MSKNIPIARGYERLTDAPLDKTSVFDTYSDAYSYAQAGITKESTAYKGQVLTVLDGPSGLSGYIINDIYELDIIQAGNTEAYTMLNFKADSDNYQYIELTQGTFLKTISVQIDTSFADILGNSLDGYMYLTLEEVDAYGNQVSDESVIIVDSSDIRTDMVGLYLFDVHYSSDYLMRVKLNFDNSFNRTGWSGSGRIKIN